MARNWKVVSVVLVLAMLFGMALAGCGNNGGDENSTTQTTDQTTTAAEQALEPVELTWYMCLNATQPDQDKVFEAANKMIKEKINATVKFIVSDAGSYEDKIKVVLASGEPADLVWTAGWKNNFFQNIAKGAFLPLDGLLAQYGKDILQEIPEMLWPALKVKGKIYGVPNYQISTMTNVMWAKKDLADKYNFDVKAVKKLEDFEPLLQAVKAGDTDIIPVDATLTGGSSKLWSSNLQAFGFEEISRDAPGVIRFSDGATPKVINQFATPEFQNYAKLVRDWYQKGYIQKDVLSVTNNNAELMAGKYAVSSFGNIAYDGEAEAKVKSSYNYDAYEVKMSDAYFTTNAIAATVTAVAQVSKNPERAVMLINMVDSDKDLFNLLAFGIENEHYTKVSDNVIKRVENSKYAHNWSWAIGNTFIGYVLDPAPADKNEKTLQTHANAKSSTLLGFVFDIEPVNAEIVQCKSVYDEMVLAITTGAVDPDKQIPAFLDKLEKAGASKVMAEEQKQIDEFLKTK